MRNDSQSKPGYVALTTHLFDKSLPEVPATLDEAIGASGGCGFTSLKVEPTATFEFTRKLPIIAATPINPTHYRSHPSGVECIQVTQHMGFNLGNAVKYIWRCDLKHDAIEDLKKAKWYIEKEIAKREAATVEVR